MSYVAARYEHLLGTVVGTGHCVPFVQAVSGAPHTSRWRRGQQVRGATLEPGTAIATFGSDGRYTNRTDGTAHAAILLEVALDGVLVVDQWVGHPVARRVIRYRGGGTSAVNDGDAFAVIEGGESA